MRYRVRYEPGHPLAFNAKGQVSEHRAVLWAKIGPGEHPCHWCGTTVQWCFGRRQGSRPADELNTDHVNSDRRDNRPENLVPSCFRCNVKRSPRSVQDDELYVIIKGRRNRAGGRTCQHCGAPFLAALIEIRKGRAVFCSRACHGAAARLGNDELFVVNAAGVRCRAVARTCEGCAAAFLAQATNVRRGGGRFCGKSCATRARHHNAAV